MHAIKPKKRLIQTAYKLLFTHIKLNNYNKIDLPTGNSILYVHLCAIHYTW